MEIDKKKWDALREKVKTKLLDSLSFMLASDIPDWIVCPIPPHENGAMYLSGAITGLNEAATALKFAQAEREAEKRGYRPVNPLKNGLPESATYEQHMERDLELLRGCDAVLMLPDWSDSPGARRELQEAVEHKKEIIFYKPTNNKKMENLLNCDGFYFKAKINNDEVAGRIRVECRLAFLCQNRWEGNEPADKLGYKYGWSVGNGNQTDLALGKVTDFHLLTPEEADEYRDWHVGDMIESVVYGHREIIFRSGELVVPKNTYSNQAEDNRTCEELYKAGYRLVLPDAQIEALKGEKPAVKEVTLDEIAEKFGVPVGKIRVKD